MDFLSHESNRGLEGLEGYHHFCFNFDSVLVVVLPPDLLLRIEVKDFLVEVWSREFIGLRLRIIHRQVVWVFEIASIGRRNVWMDRPWVVKVAISDIRRLFGLIYFLGHFQNLRSLLSNLGCFLSHIFLHRLFNLLS